ncbi:class I SAM-dependent DNA methyltransferase [Nonomuraea sp. NPDC048826]|uniref:HsdM family class I SAM-dependent methyltransferase n=1 Tax=Nonomuraea sp. NPDC048826 TaxID=3364347 RepID=UPI003720C315
MSEGEGQLAGSLWSIASLLRAEFRASEYGGVLLPLVVLRRLDCQMEADVFDRALQDSHTAAETLLDWVRQLPEEIGRVFDGFDLGGILRRLGTVRLLYPILGQFRDLDLHPARVADDLMGETFAELIDRFRAAQHDSAGEWFTPADINSLIAELVLLGSDAGEPPGPIRIYDPVCGMGGTLAAVRARLTGQSVRLYGQEINTKARAMCSASLLMAGLDPAAIASGNCLSDDRYSAETFDFLTAHPPAGVEWKRISDALQKEATERGFAGRFGAGLPRVSDSSLLFVQHLVAHMKPREAGGSRAVIVVNGSTLVNGAAGSGESQVRRWIVESGLLEGIIALPGGLFTHTALPFFLLVLSTQSPSDRGEVVFLDARGRGTTLRKPVGDKRQYFTDGEVTEIADCYRRACLGDDDARDPIEGLTVRRLKASEFGYQRVQIDRPLRLRFRVTSQAVAQLRESSVLQRYPAGEDLLSAFGGFVGRAWTTKAAFQDYVAAGLLAAGCEQPPERVWSAVVKAASEGDPGGEVQRDISGSVIADPDLRSYDRVPLGEDVAAFLRREVLYGSPLAWIDAATVKIGYELPRHLLMQTRWHGELGPLSRVARLVTKRTLPLDSRHGRPLLTASGLSAEKAADLPDAAEADRPLSLCADGDIVGYPGRWRLLPSGFGEALTTLNVLRPYVGGRTLCEWLNAMGRDRTGPPSLSMDTPVPVEAIKSPGFASLIEESDSSRAELIRLISSLFPEFPNIFKRPTEDLAGLQRVMQSKAAEAHLLGELVQPLSDPVWRAELSYPFHVAGLSRQYRTAHQVDVRKEALLKLGESLARSLGVIALAIMIQRGEEFSPILANPFTRGAGATFGTWTTLLSNFLRSGDVPELPVFESMRGPHGALSILQKIKNQRNASGHAFGVRPAHERDAEVRSLEPVVVAALESLPWLARFHWDLIEHCGYIGPGYILQGRRLRGSHPEWEPLDEEYHQQLAPHRIYLRGPLLATSIDLTPVASVSICDVCNQRELFLINKAKVSGGRVAQLTLRSDKDHEVLHDLS